MFSLLRSRAECFGDVSSVYPAGQRRHNQRVCPEANLMKVMQKSKDRAKNTTDSCTARAIYFIVVLHSRAPHTHTHTHTPIRPRSWRRSMGLIEKDSQAPTKNHGRSIFTCISRGRGLQSNSTYQRPKVDSLVVALVQDYFRGEVVRCAADGPRVARGDDLRQSEIHEFDVTLRSTETTEWMHLHFRVESADTA